MPARKKSLVRYAVVGLGYIAQAAVLPAFRHAFAERRKKAPAHGKAVHHRRAA